MAMNDSTRSSGRMNRSMAQTAAAASLIVSIACLVGLIIRLTTYDVTSGVRAYFIGWIVVFALASIFGLAMMFGRVVGQQLLLTIWLLILIGSTVLSLLALSWGKPEWWPAVFGDLPTAALVAPAVGVSLSIVVLLVLASPAASRLRYGSMVTVSIGAAVAVVIALNMIGQKDWYRRSVETLGEFGLSDGTRAIIETLDSDVHLTCVYASTDKKKRSGQYRRRVWELLEEMGEASDRVKVTNITSDAGKTKTIGRLREVLGGKSGDQVAFLRDVQGACPKLLSDMGPIAKKWRALPDEAYLFQWGRGVELAGRIDQAMKVLQGLQNTVQTKLGGRSLLDYAELAGSVNRILKELVEALKADSQWLARLDKLPSQVSRNRKAVLDGLAGAVKAADHAVKLITLRSDLGQGQAGKVLADFAEAATKASEELNKLGDLLDSVAGKDNRELVQNSRACLMPVGQGMAVPLGHFCRVVGRDFASLGGLARDYARNLKPKVQLEQIPPLHKNATELSSVLEKLDGRITGALEALAKPTAADLDILKQAAGGEYFRIVAEPISSLLKRLADLPKAERSDLIDQLNEDNTVLIEMGDRMEVASFDDVWVPSATRRANYGGQDEEEWRVFNGDSAIRSRLVKMVRQGPFATVLLTYYRPKLPPQMLQQMYQMGQRPPQDDIVPQMLGALRKRLEGANIEVKEWNLTDEMPGDQDSQDAQAATQPETAAADHAAETTKVLIVLPPLAQGQTSFGSQQEDRLRKAIDSGTPAVFLTHFIWPRSSMRMQFMPPTQPAYALAGYLRRDWGVNALTDYRLVAAVPDEETPGQFKLSQSRFFHMSLTSFSKDHPISRPSRGLRTLWTDVCPLMSVEADRPPGVEHTALLKSPASREVWASKDIVGRLVSQLYQEGSRIRPDYDEGDLAPPFTVALAATRAEDPGRKITPARIVVLSLGASLVDGYLDRPVPTFGGGDSLVMAPPPKANAGIVINSVYWLSGNKQWIGSPTRAEPMDDASEQTMRWLWCLCVIGAPALVVLAGLAVWSLRRT